MAGTSTNGVGVFASTQNANENAIFGINTATGPATNAVNAIAGCGVWGHTNVAGGTGVVGSTDPRHLARRQSDAQAIRRQGTREAPSNTRVVRLIV